MPTPKKAKVRDIAAPRHIEKRVIRQLEGFIADIEKENTACRLYFRDISKEERLIIAYYQFMSPKASPYFGKGMQSATLKAEADMRLQYTFNKLSHITKLPTLNNWLLKQLETPDKKWAKWAIGNNFDNEQKIVRIMHAIYREFSKNT